MDKKELLEQISDYLDNHPDGEVEIEGFIYGVLFNPGPYGWGGCGFGSHTLQLGMVERLRGNVNRALEEAMAEDAKEDEG
jgi:hypothetical protein